MFCTCSFAVFGCLFFWKMYMLFWLLLFLWLYLKFFSFISHFLYIVFRKSVSQRDRLSWVKVMFEQNKQRQTDRTNSKTHRISSKSFMHCFYFIFTLYLYASGCIRLPLQCICSCMHRMKIFPWICHNIPMMKNKDNTY